MCGFDLLIWEKAKILYIWLHTRLNDQLLAYYFNKKFTNLEPPNKHIIERLICSITLTFVYYLIEHLMDM